MYLPHLVIALTLLLLLPTLTLAQFDFFPFGQNPFGGGQPQQEQQQSSGWRAHKGWAEYEGVHCRAGYVCPESLACVPTPADCPCPYPEDLKCVIPDPRPRDEGEGLPFICARGSQGCAEAMRFAKAI